MAVLGQRRRHRFPSRSSFRLPSFHVGNRSGKVRVTKAGRAAVRITELIRAMSRNLLSRLNPRTFPRRPPVAALSLSPGNFRETSLAAGSAVRYATLPSASLRASLATTDSHASGFDLRSRGEHEPLCGVALRAEEIGRPESEPRGSPFRRFLASAIPETEAPQPSGWGASCFRICGLRWRWRDSQAPRPSTEDDEVAASTRTPTGQARWS